MLMLFAELASHFMLQYAVFSLLTAAVVIFYYPKFWWIYVALICIGLFSGAQVAALSKPRQVSKSEVYDDVSILHFNLFVGNPITNKIAGWILAMPLKPDIIVLQEVTPRIEKAIADLEKEYPYKVMHSAQNAYGMALFSRLPIESNLRNNFPNSGNCYSEYSFQTPNKKIPFILTEIHATSPLGFGRVGRRKLEFEHIAEVLKKQSEKSQIVLGDMNTSPYSPWFKDLLVNSGLGNAMQGVSTGGTWPSVVPAVLRIPLDNTLLSDNIEVVERSLEKAHGSDHLPVLSRLRIYKLN